MQEISEKDNTTSTCDIIDSVIYDLHADEDDLPDGCGTRENIPEWYAQEPKQSNKPVIFHNYPVSGKPPTRVDYWWTHGPAGDRARVRALKRCINLTK